MNGLASRVIAANHRGEFCSQVHRVGLPSGLDGKESARSAGDLGLIHGLGRFPGVGNGNPLQYACLENSVDRGALWGTVHMGSQSHTRLSD